MGLVASNQDSWAGPCWLLPSCPCACCTLYPLAVPSSSGCMPVAMLIACITAMCELCDTACRLLDWLSVGNILDMCSYALQVGIWGPQHFESPFCIQLRGYHLLSRAVRPGLLLASTTSTAETVVIIMIQRCCTRGSCRLIHKVDDLLLLSACLSITSCISHMLSCPMHSQLPR
jgi:hypothetical protein